MPNTVQTAQAAGLCGKWMPRSKTTCARGAGHRGTCRSQAGAEHWRERNRLGKRVVTPEARRRWNQAYKFVRIGITEEQFNRLLKEQGYACAMCRTPFGDTFPQVDHDHSCCRARQGKSAAKLCGKCIRGLLCFRCNTALGYVEKYAVRARDYLDNPPGARI